MCAKLEKHAKVMPVQKYEDIDNEMLYQGALVFGTGQSVRNLAIGKRRGALNEYRIRAERRPEG